MNRDYFLPFISLVLITISGSCKYKEVRNVVISVIVQDSVTKEPIEGAEVVILGWKQNNIDDLNYKLRKEVTDFKGQFQAEFERALRIDIAVKAIDYKVADSTIKQLTKQENVVSLKLIKETEGNTAIYISSEPPESDSLYWGVRYYHSTSLRNFEEVWGFNMNKKKTTNRINDADIWIQTANNKSYKEWILFTRNGWGIQPIYYDEVNGNLIINKAEAPQGNYLEKYKIRGSEVGYFLRGKNGMEYAKIILTPYSIDNSIPLDTEGYYEEKIQPFQIIYQKDGSTNLEVNPKFDLETYLLGLPW